MPLHRNYDYIEIVPAQAFAAAARASPSPYVTSNSYVHSCDNHSNYMPISSVALDNSSYASPYANRTFIIPTAPSSCGMAYRLNMTVHDPQSFSPESATPTFYTLDERKSKKHRVSRALRELLGRSVSSRKGKSNPLDCSFRSESPRKRRQKAPSAILSRSIVHFPQEMDRSISVYDIDNPRNLDFTNPEKMEREEGSSSTSGGSFYETINHSRRDMNMNRSKRENPPNYAAYYHARTPSADPAWLYARENAKTAEKERERCKHYQTTTPVRVESFALPEPKSIEIRNIKNGYKKKDAFVNSQEWTMSRTISELRLGIIGSANSGKTSLVHRYLTGHYTAEESPEGGRFKKETVIDGHSHLLLIRDEGQSHIDLQFCQWADAVVFVYSVTCKPSFERVKSLYREMSKCRHLNDLPMLLVGTKDDISEKNPRVISEDEGKQLAGQLKRCAYYETCATYGLNVERVFKDACTKILQQRLRVSFGQSTRTPTPTTPYGEKQNRGGEYQDPRYMSSLGGTMYGSQQMGGTLMQPPHGSQASSTYGKNVYGTSSGTRAVSSVIVDGPGSVRKGQGHVQQREGNGRPADRSISAMFLPKTRENSSAAHHHNQYASGFDYRQLSPSSSQKSVNAMANGIHSRSSAALLDSSACEGVNLLATGGAPFGATSFGAGHAPSEHYAPSAMTSASTSHLPTPSSTPNTQRKNRRISNIFQRPKDHESEKNKAIEALNQGVGRVIPVKQGLLYKKSSKTALNREWKKKYVCLYSDGRLKYYQNLKDYMDKNVQGKEVFLGLATVKVSGRQRPRATQRNSQASGSVMNGNSSQNNMSGSTNTGGNVSGSSSMAASMTTDEQMNSMHSGSVTTLGSMMSTSTLCPQNNGTPMLKSYEARKSDAGIGCSGEGTSGGGSDDAKDTPSSTPIVPQTVAGGKKRRGNHKRLGSSGKNGQDEDDECFEIITHAQQRWEFCAASADERDEWVAAIEDQIEKALQMQMSGPTTRATGNKDQVQALRQLPGNQSCADCSRENPDWASLNLGTLICIECSGIHRNLGSHISRVRSLELDDWPVEYLAVMRELGNEKANRLWEHNAPKDKKPQPNSPRDVKEAWIRSKYEAKRYLPPLRVDETVSSQLVAAVIARDVAATSLLLARATPEDVNAPVSQRDQRTPLHLACSNGSLEIVQLLFWNNADMRALDEQGRSCLWYAHNAGFQEGVEVLLAAGLTSDYGMPPLGQSNAAISSSSANVMGHAIPENAILGSMASRDYSYIGSNSNSGQENREIPAFSARFRPGNQMNQSQTQRIESSGPAPPIPSARKLHSNLNQQQQKEFENMPASVI